MESIAAFLGSGCSSRETEIMNEVLSRWARDTSRGACRRLDYSCAAGCAAAPDLDAILPERRVGCRGCCCCWLADC